MMGLPVHEYSFNFPWKCILQVETFDDYYYYYYFLHRDTLNHILYITNNLILSIIKIVCAWDQNTEMAIHVCLCIYIRVQQPKL